MTRFAESVPESLLRIRPWAGRPEAESSQAQWPQGEEKEVTWENTIVKNSKSGLFQPMGTASAKAETCDKYGPSRSSSDWVHLEGGTGCRVRLGKQAGSIAGEAGLDQAMESQERLGSRGSRIRWAS